MSDGFRHNSNEEQRLEDLETVNGGEQFGRALRQTLEETQAVCAEVKPGEMGPGVKADAGKPDLILFPFRALRGTVLSLEYQDLAELLQAERFAEAWEHLVDTELCSIEDVTEILEFGAVKYSPNNWQGVRPGVRYGSGSLRHLLAIERGEDYDPDSKKRHFAHIGCNVIFCLWMQQQGINLWATE